MRRPAGTSRGKVGECSAHRKVRTACNESARISWTRTATCMRGSMLTPTGDPYAGAKGSGSRASAAPLPILTLARMFCWRSHAEGREVAAR